MFSVVATARGDRRGDEALDQVGLGAGIGRGDRDHRLLDLRILADRQVEDALEAEQQDACSASTVESTGRRMKSSEKCSSLSQSPCCSRESAWPDRPCCRRRPARRWSAGSGRRSPPRRRLPAPQDLDQARAPAGLDEHLRDDELRLLRGAVRPAWPPRPACPLQPARCGAGLTT